MNSGIILGVVLVLAVFGSSGVWSQILTTRTSSTLSTTTNIVVLHPTIRRGMILAASMNETEFRNNFDSSGLGRLEYLGYAYTNGLNGTPDLRKGFPVNYDSSDPFFSTMFERGNVVAQDTVIKPKNPATITLVYVMYIGPLCTPNC